MKSAVSCRRAAVLCRRAVVLSLLLMMLGGGVSALAQAYTSIVVFGDSLSDTGNAAAVSNAKYGFSAQVPGPLTGYTNGRFTDGTDTLPAARNYTGVWVEQLAAMLPAKPAVSASLTGGRDYAYGFATTNTGTTPFTYGPGNGLSFTVANMGQQVLDYFATRPTINSATLFVVWGGANDLLNATSSADIVAAASREVVLVQRLIAAGATNIVVPNLPPLGLVPRLNGSAAAAAQATAAAQGFNQALAAGLAQLQTAAGSSVRIFPLDIYTLFNTVVGPPVAPGFANVTRASQGMAVNPDTYLFWDDLHPTTYGHSMIAAAALRLLNPTVATTVSLASSASSANLGSSVTLTASVAAGSGTPQGTVTFLDGATVLGTQVVTGTATTATASLSTAALTAGPHTITASFAGVNGFGSSASAATTVTVVAPGFTAALSPTSLTLARGATGSSTLTVTPVGGYTGSFAVACGSVSGIVCSVQISPLNVSGTTAASTNIVISATRATAANRIQALPGLPASSRVEYAVLGLSLLSGLSLARRRMRNLRSAALFVLPALLSLAVLLGLSGCGSSANANASAAGTYSVPVTITPSTGAAQTVTLSVSVQ